MRTRVVRIGRERGFELPDRILLAVELVLRHGQHGVRLGRVGVDRHDPGEYLAQARVVFRPQVSLGPAGRA